MITIEIYIAGELSHVIYNLSDVDTACTRAYKEFSSDDSVDRVVVLKDGETVCEYVD